MGLSTTGYILGWLMYNYIKAVYIAVVTLVSIYYSNMRIDD